MVFENEYILSALSYKKHSLGINPAWAEGPKDLHYEYQSRNTTSSISSTKPLASLYKDQHDGISSASCVNSETEAKVLLVIFVKA
jgi:hypothetical protein